MGEEALLPGPQACQGSFEAARVRAFQTGKVLVAAVRGVEESKAEHLQTLTLASDEIASLLHENTVFWMGSVTELRLPHVQQLAPCGVPSLAVVLPIAADAMKVLSVSPGTDTETIVASVVDGLEALEDHREAAEARLVNEEALLRYEQDE